MAQAFFERDAPTDVRVGDLMEPAARRLPPTRAPQTGGAP